MRIYVDSSGLVKLAIREAGSIELQHWLRGHDLVSSAIAKVEVGRAVRRSPDAQRSMGAILGPIKLVAVDEDVLAAAVALQPPSLRALDAIHLATALLIASDLDVFVTYDRQQGRAATAVGLHVESPR